MQTPLSSNLAIKIQEDILYLAINYVPNTKFYSIRLAMPRSSTHTFEFFYFPSCMPSQALGNNSAIIIYPLYNNGGRGWMVVSPVQS